MGHFSKKAGFFTASRKRFFSETKPLILQAKTAVKPNNVKYVFLTERLKTRLLEHHAPGGCLNVSNGPALVSKHLLRHGVALFSKSYLPNQRCPENLQLGGGKEISGLLQDVLIDGLLTDQLLF